MIMARMSSATKGSNVLMYLLIIRSRRADTNISVLLFRKPLIRVIALAESPGKNIRASIVKIGLQFLSASF